MRAALIKGSVAEYGRLPAGGDVDLCVITPVEPGPDWFEEVESDGVPVEVYPVAEQDLRDENVLASPDLPFAICAGIVVDDPDRMVSALRSRLLPRLCEPACRLARVSACYGPAQLAFRSANAALQAGDHAEARAHVVRGLWHTSAMPSAIACLCPTNRRAFVRLEQLAHQWGREDLIHLAEDAIGSRTLTAERAWRLLDEAAKISPRNRDAIAPLLHDGDIKASAWPFLFAAVTRTQGTTDSPVARRAIVTTLGFSGPINLRRRIEAGEDLCHTLRSLADSLLPLNA